MNPVSKLVFGLGAALSVVSLVVACGSSDGSEFGDGGGPTFIDQDGSFGEGGIDSGDLYANDPLPKYCLVDGGVGAPPLPTGTDQCPSDKNKPGCGCDTLGATAACWTGLRANRNLGQCKDGMTTCVQVSENTKAWGPCSDEVLPTVGAKGKAGCSCFSEGRWKITNLIPCFVNKAGSGTFYAYSAKQNPDNSVTCGAIPSGDPPYPPADPDHWSTDTVSVDCAGHFKLCYEIKGGKYETPGATDCSLTKVCVEGDYPAEGQEVAFPNLPAWHSENTACAQVFRDVGGYGEMTVQGISVRCDNVDDGTGNAFVFNRVKYCPTKCENGANPSDPDCANCQTGGSGQF